MMATTAKKVAKEAEPAGVATAAEVNLAGFSTQELRQLARDVERELKQRQVEDRRTALRAIKELAASQGFTLEELVDTGLRRTRRPSAPPTTRYRNPDNPEQTWAGRGRKPGWLVELLAQGKTLEGLLSER
jgi:DNA-binding protein H-NS